MPQLPNFTPGNWSGSRNVGVSSKFYSTVQRNGRRRFRCTFRRGKRDLAIVIQIPIFFGSGKWQMGPPKADSEKKRRVFQLADHLNSCIGYFSIYISSVSYLNTLRRSLFPRSICRLILRKKVLGTR